MLVKTLWDLGSLCDVGSSSATVGWMWQLECPSQLLPAIPWEQYWEALPLADTELWFFQASEGKAKKHLYSTGSIIDHLVSKLQENGIRSQLMWFESFDVILKDLSVRGTKLWDREEQLGRNFVSIRLWFKIWVFFPLCWWKIKPSNRYFSFDSTVKSSWIWVLHPSHQSWGAEILEVSLLGQMLVFCSLQPPAEAMLGSTARRKIFRETLLSPLSCRGGTEPCGCWEWLSGVITSVVSGKPGKCSPAWRLSWILPVCSQPSCCSLLTELGCTTVPAFLFQHVKTMWEIFNINFLFSFLVTQDLVMAIHSSAHLKQDTQWNQNTCSLGDAFFFIGILVLSEKWTLF